MVITDKNLNQECNQDCITTINQSATIVTGLDKSFHAYTEERAIVSFFNVLHKRTGRLVSDSKTRRKLNPLLRKFVCNLVMYFKDAGELDDFTLTNIITAISLADNHSEASYGTVDYSTLIRRPNPTHPDTDKYFVIGREGRVDDSGCPIKTLKSQSIDLSLIPLEQLNVYYGFYNARQLDPNRDAPKIRVEDFNKLVPSEIKDDPDLEEAFTEVCLSDGAWELYQRKVAA